MLSFSDFLIYRHFLGSNSPNIIDNVAPFVSTAIVPDREGRRKKYFDRSHGINRAQLYMFPNLERMQIENESIVDNYCWISALLAFIRNENIGKLISVAVCKTAWKHVIVMNWMVQHTGVERLLGPTLYRIQRRD